MTSVKVVKSDARGRIPGIAPGGSYKVTEHGDGSYTVAPVVPDVRVGGRFFDDVTEPGVYYSPSRYGMSSAILIISDPQHTTAEDVCEVLAVAEANGCDKVTVDTEGIGAAHAMLMKDLAAEDPEMVGVEIVAVTAGIKNGRL